MSARPEPAYPPPDGHRHVPAVDTGWRLDQGRRCRFTVRGHRQCGADSVAAFNRGRHSRTHGRVDSWWAYCADHLYGRWIEDGNVMHWIAVPDEEDET